MASELENSIRSAAAKVAAYVADAAVMEVTTSYVVVGDHYHRECPSGGKNRHSARRRLPCDRTDARGAGWGVGG